MGKSGNKNPIGRSKKLALREGDLSPEEELKAQQEYEARRQAEEAEQERIRQEETQQQTKQTATSAAEAAPDSGNPAETFGSTENAADLGVAEQTAIEENPPATTEEIERFRTDSQGILQQEEQDADLVLEIEPESSVFVEPVDDADLSRNSEEIGNVEALTEEEINRILAEFPLARPIAIDSIETAETAGATLEAPADTAPIIPIEENMPKPAPAPTPIETPAVQPEAKMEIKKEELKVGDKVLYGDQGKDIKEYEVLEITENGDVRINFPISGHPENKILIAKNIIEKYNPRPISLKAWEKNRAAYMELLAQKYGNSTGESGISPKKKPSSNIIERKIEEWEINNPRPAETEQTLEEHEDILQNLDDLANAEPAPTISETAPQETVAKPAASAPDNLPVGQMPGPKPKTATESPAEDEFRGIFHPEGPQLGPAKIKQEQPKTPIDETDAAYREFGGNLLSKSMEEIEAEKPGQDNEFEIFLKDLEAEREKQAAAEKAQRPKEIKETEKTKEQAPETEAVGSDLADFTARENIFARFIKNKLERLDNWGDRILGHRAQGENGAAYNLPHRLFGRFKNLFDNKLFSSRNAKALKFEQYANEANQQLAEQEAIVEAYIEKRNDTSLPWRERAKAEKNLFASRKKLEKIKSNRHRRHSQLEKMEGLKEACHGRIVERSQTVAESIKERTEPYKEKMESGRLVVRELKKTIDQAGSELVDWQSRLDELKLQYPAAPRKERAAFKAAMADIKSELKKRRQILKEANSKMRVCSGKMNHLQSLINPWDDLAGAYEEMAGRPVYWTGMKKEAVLGSAPAPSERGWESRGVDFNSAAEPMEALFDESIIKPREYFRRSLSYLESIAGKLSAEDLAAIAKNGLDKEAALKDLEKAIVELFQKKGIAEDKTKQRLATIRLLAAQPAKN